jgi:predicted metal-dependent RNase
MAIGDLLLGGLAGPLVEATADFNPLSKMIGKSLGYDVGDDDEKKKKKKEEEAAGTVPGTMKRGGKVRGCGIATKGKTRGRMV